MVFPRAVDTAASAGYAFGGYARLARPLQQTACCDLPVCCPQSAMYICCYVPAHRLGLITPILLGTRGPVVKCGRRLTS